MHVRIGITTGEIVVSDDLPRAELEEFIADNDGRLGNDDLDRVRVESVEDAIAFIDQIWARSLGDDDATLTATVNGESRKFSGDEVAWYRWVKEN